MRHRDRSYIIQKLNYNLAEMKKKEENEVKSREELLKLEKEMAAAQTSLSREQYV